MFAFLLSLTTLVSLSNTNPLPAEPVEAPKAIVVYILADGGAFSLASVQGAYPQSWRNVVQADVYGYTATDDLWTFLPKAAPESSFAALRIELADVGHYYPSVHACLQDLQGRAKLLDADSKLVLE